jgi:DUF1680 family protein
MSLSIRSAVAPVVPPTGKLRPLGLSSVTLTDGFWADRQATNLRGTLPHIRHWLDREGWIANFDLIAESGLVSERRGREFTDSEVYKYLEAIAWTLGQGDLNPSDAVEWEETFRAVVVRISAAQDNDGYLNTNFGHANQQSRWSNLEWGHELYCLGHLFQAAVARMRTAPGSNDGLVGVARRAADLICEAFGVDGIQSVCGHAEIEVGLAELARATGDDRYAAQAELFIARRGHGVLRDIEYGRSYYQDDIPVRDATVLRGHAVRANYLAAGAVDVAVDGKDTGLLDALKTQWTSTLARRTYVTGGQGSHHQDEGFGADWELPPDRAYSETCAGIASIMFSWRLLLHDGDTKYADLIERTLFNVVATSPAADGRSFYYSNTLHQREATLAADPDEISPRASSSQRAPWFEVSCCPPNVARTMASLAAYIATADAGGVQIHQFASSTIRTVLEGGQNVDLEVVTDYPRNGLVSVRIGDGLTSAVPWTIALRVPRWAAGAQLVYRPANGQEREVAAVPGSAEVTELFLGGDVIELTLPMQPRMITPDPRIDAVRGAVFIERGPEVLCLESVDLPAGDPVSLEDFRLDVDAGIWEDDGRVNVALLDHRIDPAPWPYGLTHEAVEPVRLTAPLVPYHSWALRGSSTMRVWIPTE